MDEYEILGRREKAIQYIRLSRLGLEHQNYAGAISDLRKAINVLGEISQ